MSQLDEVLNLVQVLRERGENPVLVVSAFKGVTNALYKALDELDGNDYNEDSIETALGTAFEIVNGKIDEFIQNDELKQKAGEHVQIEMNILKNALLTHRDVTNILSPGEKTYQVRDKVIAFGERSVIGVLEAYLKDNDISACAVNDVEYKGNGKTTGDGLSKRELHRGIQRGIAESLAPYGEKIDRELLVVGGHVRNTLRGMTTEIGRSYTDTTAVDVAIALRDRLDMVVDEVVAWKDVDGVMSADPKRLDPKVNKPVTHSDVSLSEALELALSGSLLMQADALALGRDEGVQLKLGNISKPDAEGTTFSTGESLTEYPFKAVTAVDIITVACDRPTDPSVSSLFSREVSGIFHKNGLNFNNVSTSGLRTEYYFNLPKDRADQIDLRRRTHKAFNQLKRLKLNAMKYNCKPSKDEGKVNIVMVGDELPGSTGILATIATVFSAMGIGVDGIVQLTDQRKISFYVHRNYANGVVQALHRIFIDKDKIYAESTRREGERIVSSKF